MTRSTAGQHERLWFLGTQAIIRVPGEAVAAAAVSDGAAHCQPCQALGALVDGYGEPWAAELVLAWSGKQRFYEPKGQSPEAWMASLPGLCLALREAGDGGGSAARMLLRESWRGG